MANLFQQNFKSYKNNELHITEFLEKIEKKEFYIEVFDYISKHKGICSDFRFFLYYILKNNKNEIFEEIYNQIIKYDLITENSIKFFIEYSKYTNKKDNLLTILNYLDLSSLTIDNEINFIKNKLHNIYNIENF